jgi:hypothetical protein
VINSETTPSASLPVTGTGLTAEVYLRRWVSGQFAPIKATPEVIIRYNPIDPVELVSDVKLTCTMTNDPNRPYRCEYKDSGAVSWGRVRLLKTNSERFKKDAKETDIDMKILISDH